MRGIDAVEDGALPVLQAGACWRGGGEEAVSCWSVGEALGVGIQECGAHG